MKGKVVGLIILCLLANSASSLSTAEISNTALLEGISANRSILVNFFSTCAQPVDILNRLINEENPLNANTSAPQPVKHKDNNQNTSSNCFIFDTNKKPLIYSASFLRENLQCQSAPTDLFQLPDMMVRSGHHPPGHPGYIVLFFLMFIILLPRSGLPEGSILFRAAKT